MSNIRPVPDRLGAQVLESLRAIWPDLFEVKWPEPERFTVTVTCKHCGEPYTYQTADKRVTSGSSKLLRRFCDRCLKERRRKIP